MKRSRVYKKAVVLILGILVASGCAVPKTTPVPTVIAQPNPTAQNGTTNPPPAITITFSAKDTCSLEGATTITSPTQIKWVVDNQKHAHYGLVIVTLNPGKTIADVQAWTSGDKPSWATDVYDFDAKPGSQQEVTIYLGPGTIYFGCLYGDPTKTFGGLGPVQVVKAP